MSVLGILTCEILELEFAYLLGKDKDIKRITVVDDQRSDRLIQKLQESDGLALDRVSEINAFQSDDVPQIEVVVQVLELALHNRKRTLQEGLQQAAHAMGPYVDALLLGYGLCGNALEDPEKLLADAGVPIFIPMDEDHPVDDCVGLFIGGRKRYYGEQCKVAGTFFMIPGWTYHWQRMFEQEFGSITVDVAKQLFKNYERSLLVSSPVMSETRMKANIREFNNMFGLRTEACEGSFAILLDTWNAAKNFLHKQT